MSLTDRTGYRDNRLDMLFEIQRGNIPNLSLRSIRGRNPDVDSATEDIIPWGGLYAFQSAAVAMQVLSTVAADDGAPPGTGARTVRIEGLDGAFNPITEDVVMNGVTVVATVNTYRRINRFFVLTAGSGSVNAGDITLRTVAGAVIQAQIPVGESQSRHGVATVPTGQVWYAESGIVDIRKGTADDVEVALMVRDLAVPDSPLLTVGDVSVQGQGTSTIQIGFNFQKAQGPADLLLRAYNASANNNGVLATLSVVVEA